MKLVFEGDDPDLTPWIQRLRDEGREVDVVISEQPEVTIVRPELRPLIDPRRINVFSDLRKEWPH